MTELRGIPTLPTMQLDQRLENRRVIGASDWSKAQERERIIRDSLQGDSPTTVRVEGPPEPMMIPVRSCEISADVRPASRIA